MSRRMSCLGAVLLVGLLATSIPAAESPRPEFSVATFQVDATPPIGQPMIWDVPLARVVYPLWAKGVVIQHQDDRFILLTLDWCELCNDSELSLRKTLAEAAKTSVNRISIHVVHQHAAPYADQGAHRYLDQAPTPAPRLSDFYLHQLSTRLADAAREALSRLEPFDSIGTGQAKVDRVASARRLKNPDGTILTRFSSGATNPKLAEAPEGQIDPWLKTVTLARGQTPLVRLHFYATHPQTFACDGRASSDIVGAARERIQREEGIFQIYFTGCAGDITVGKYNDGSESAWQGLTDRLAAGVRDSIASTRFQPLRYFAFRSVDLILPLREDEAFTRPALLKNINSASAPPYTKIYAGAMRLAFRDRHDRPLLVRCLELENVSILQLPGEPMLEFQRFAQSLRPDRFVATGGYFDVGPGYVCTDQAYDEGGYEPSASHAGPGSEARLKQAIRQALSASAQAASEGGSR